LSVLHDRGQQGVRLLRPVAVRREVIRPLEEQRVDVLERDEVLDVDRLGARRMQIVELVLLEDHHLAPRGLVRLPDALVLDLAAALLGDALVSDA
jgi:hypothetical protein